MHCDGTEDVDKCRWLRFVAQFGSLAVKRNHGFKWFLFRMVWHVLAVFASVFCLFRLLQKCEGELQALVMSICIAGPKVGGVSGPTSSTCFLPHKEEGFVGLIFHSSFATRLCLCYSDSILLFMLF